MELIIKLLSISFGFCAYIPIAWLIIKNKIKPSFCTWLLWTLLNIVTLISLIQTGAPYFIAAVYTVGTLLITIVLLLKKRFIWERTDTFILVLVLVCIFILIFSNSFAATIAGSLASFIAGIPDLKKILHNPKNISRLAAVLLISANVLAIISTNDLSFINIVYPISWASYWVTAIGLSLRKK